jgi:hypothetical protein
MELGDQLTKSPHNEYRSKIGVAKDTSNEKIAFLVGLLKRHKI